ncbi:hypothetical protein HYW54_03850 [Candidatus Gottesmanbacteria bacterium]|nr:hypothetical protein [Candidatus Gottesmanbacteria bacterium]
MWFFKIIMKVEANDSPEDQPDKNSYTFYCERCEDLFTVNWIFPADRQNDMSFTKATEKGYIRGSITYTIIWAGLRDPLTYFGQRHFTHHHLGEEVDLSAIKGYG